MQLIDGNNINDIIKNYNLTNDDFDKPLKYLKIFLNNIEYDSNYKEKIIKLEKKIYWNCITICNFIFCFFVF